MTPENVLYTANAHGREGRENGTARTDACRLDIKLSPVAVSSILIFTASWKKWFCVLRHHKGFGLFDSVRFGLWLARGGAEARTYRSKSGALHQSYTQTTPKPPSLDSHLPYSAARSRTARSNQNRLLNGNARPGTRG
jgi:hypothetical protein